MPFVSSCCCPRRVARKYGEVTSDQSRSCSREEIRWLDIDSDLKSKGRKRKNCISCRYRLQIDLKSVSQSICNLLADVVPFFMEILLINYYYYYYYY